MLKPPPDQPQDSPGVIAFPPLIWLVNAVISVLVHLFIRVPIMSYRVCLVCGIVFIILAPTLALSAFMTMKAGGTNILPSKPALTICAQRAVSFHPESGISRVLFIAGRAGLFP